MSRRRQVSCSTNYCDNTRTNPVWSSGTALVRRPGFQCRVDGSCADEMGVFGWVHCRRPRIDLHGHWIVSGGGNNRELCTALRHSAACRAIIVVGLPLGEVLLVDPRLELVDEVLVRIGRERNVLTIEVRSLLPH